jgi:putative glutathione S-transferase
MAASKPKAHTALDEVDAKGNFKRTAAGFSNRISPGGRFEPEKGRYHLYVALGCPWAAGTLTALYFKGLEEVISFSVVHPTWRRTRPEDPEDTHCGWHFRAPGDAPVSNELGHGSNECDDACVPDTVNGCKTMRELYELANDETGKYSTPLLWCKKERTAVCNESMDILRMFDECFQELCKHPEQRLFVPELMASAETLNEFIYPTVNNGVYRCGFARSQEAYDTALGELYQSLDKLEQHLQSGPFLTGERFQWIDLRLYHTLVRFDPVYVTYFKTNLKRIEDYPNLLAFLRRCYRMDAVKKSTNIRHIKMHYFTSHPTLNTYGWIPAANGPVLDSADCKM